MDIVYLLYTQYIYNYERSTLDTQMDICLLHKTRPIFCEKVRENVGENMCLDDKEINGKSFSILSDEKTGKMDKNETFIGS